MRALIWAGAFASVIYWIALYARWRWKALQSKMNTKPPHVQELERPGLLGEHLKAAQWSRALSGAMVRAGQSLSRLNHPAAVAASAALKTVLPMSSDFEKATQTAAERTLTSGELQSLLIKSGDSICYVLVFPGRHEHVKLFRRYPPFAEGWIEHVSHLRRELDAAKLLTFLCFLGPGAREGILLLAYDSDNAKLRPAMLVDEDETTGSDSLPFDESFDFQLSYGIGSVAETSEAGKA